MRLLVISSSPNKEKSSTFVLAKEVLRGFSDEAVEWETIHLCDFKLNFCRHCEECHKKILDCSIKDNVPEILKKMLAADGIILASPNYINQITASMKAIFDRSTHFIHCRRLSDKYIAGVVSSGSGEDKDVLDYIKYYVNTCAAQYSGGVFCKAPITREKIDEAYQLGKKMSLDIKEKSVFPEQMRVIGDKKEHFKKLIERRKEDWPEEYQYWQDKGWL